MRMRILKQNGRSIAEQTEHFFGICKWAELFLAVGADEEDGTEQGDTGYDVVKGQFFAKIRRAEDKGDDRVHIFIGKGDSGAHMV